MSVAPTALQQENFLTELRWPARLPKIIVAPADLDTLEEIVNLVRVTASSMRSPTLTVKQMARYVSEIRKYAKQLDEAANVLDLVAQPKQIIDPNDPKFQAVVLALRFIQEERHPLSDLTPFYGSGVYALYYTGPLLPYAPIAGSETPIYVGKADPDIVSVKPIEQGIRLYTRLVEHLRNIEKVGLYPKHFEYRYLPLGDGTQVSVEKVLIDFFKPVWNNEGGCLSGFGKHGDSASTRANKRSSWDILHPGRTWAEKSEPKRSHNEVLSDVAEHFALNPVYQTMAQIVERLRF
ncbi:Eco29kI family restriction endonuclease [Rhizobium sp. MHM7A]|uniref:Eco29kI family restriction endonuclease n=1 Tax=Rhizobium sp. MHM7A TaxID=2583233 RepID=UPI001105B51D|nr:Eco29kI family restriction endonuclease [Rhizobium sp. MHM7A]TLX16053.1 Eco29kI family restriction endonuclease [Rhizobium sp. MHM7A]